MTLTRSSYWELVNQFLHVLFVCDNVMFTAERSESKIQVIGRLSTMFQCLRQLGEAREQLTMFRYKK